MKKIAFVLSAGIALIACKNESTSEPLTVNYPVTEKVDTVDTYFGVEVADPYRWMEDDRSPETENWVAEQNKVTFGYLEQIPFREDLKKRMEKLWDYEKVSAPFKEGSYTYYYKNDGLQNQSVVYRKKMVGTKKFSLIQIPFLKMAPPLLRVWVLARMDP